MPIVNFVSEKKQVQVPEGTNLRKAALEAGVGLYPHVHKVFNCHGFAQCGTCRVNITQGVENAGSKGFLGFLGKLRLKASFAYIDNEETMRLACQTQVNGDMTVETKPPMNLFGENFFS